MPLNYSKWDQLELSDDSDIEGHPNVDKRSLIRWKQRDIHEKREVRKARIAALRAEIDCNQVLIPRFESLSAALSSPPDGLSPEALYNQTVEKLQTLPSDAKPPSDNPQQKTYDALMLEYLLKVVENVKSAGKGGDVGSRLKAELDNHVVQLRNRNEEQGKELEKEEKEQKKHITSDDLKDGFDSKYIPPKPEPPPVPGAKVKTKKTETTEIEVLNPKASSSSPASTTHSAEDDDDDNASLLSLTPTLILFSQLPIRGYQASWEFIQSHRDVIVPGASDALLVAAFKAQRDGNGEYAKKCVHQSLLLQYCDKLGVDGVRVFFRKMVAGDGRAEMVFVKDVNDTYEHIVSRVAASEEEEALGRQEQIQLVPENPSQSISFNIPSGPPPEELVLEGPGTEDLNVEDVRRALQLRWTVFEGLSDEIKEALKGGSLDSVNKVLGAMKVEEAEEVVRLLDVGGILSFAEGGIRDETGRDEAGDVDDEEVDTEEIKGEVAMEETKV